MEIVDNSPTPNSYWVIPQQLLAGEYPGSSYAVRTRQTLEQLIQAGITVFIDLTEKGEYIEYEPFLDLAAKPLKRLTAYYRFPIKDETTPSIDEMIEILDAIDTTISVGRKAYVHCLHGRGRTGTVVGCWLVRHGLKSNEVTAKIAHLRQSLLFGATLSSPRTPAQQEMVLNWTIGQ
jgi:protein-tyrosine phosphatase